MPWKQAYRWRWEIVLAGCILLSVSIMMVSEGGRQRLEQGFNTALETQRVNAQHGRLIHKLDIAESDQRGYLITANPLYLAPYEKSIAEARAELRSLSKFYASHGHPAQTERMNLVAKLVEEKIAELDLSLRWAKSGRWALAKDLVSSNIGKSKMDELRTLVEEMQASERADAERYVGDWRTSLQLSRVGVGAVTALNIVLLILLIRWLKREWGRSEKRQESLDRVVRERSSQLRALAHHLQDVSELEKSRLAREMHDTLGSLNTATKMDVSWVRGKLGPEQGVLAEKLDRALRNIDQGIQIKRQIIEGLRPSTLSNFGLVTAARELAEQTAEQAGWKLQLDFPDDDPDLSEDSEIALFRILQEAFTNAAKHAKATHVRVSIACESGGCSMEIEDDGVGFDPKVVHTQGHGLFGMRQRLESRGGRFEIISTPFRGTKLLVYLPFAATAPLRADVKSG